MKLERLSLANFRGFQQIDIEFSDDITVIAGVNGVGKSGVLKALATAMSEALPLFTASREDTLSFSETDIQSGKPSLSMWAKLRTDTATMIVNVDRVAPMATDKTESLTKRRDELRFSTRGAIKGSKEEREIQDEIDRIDDQLSPVLGNSVIRILPNDAATDTRAFIDEAKSSGRQPLAVFYSTSRLFSRLPPILPKTKAIDTSAAYIKSLNQPEISLNDFANWYRVVEETASPEKRDRVFQQLERAIGSFLPEVVNLTLHKNQPPRFSVTKSGKTLFLEQLSDGERGLLALVFDLTRRLTIANPDSDNPIAEGAAVVLIDEIELHLHPKWQRDVLKRLRGTFQSCQFIVTTHSPLVLGEVEARCIRFLEFRDERVIVTTPSEAYGMDANRILQELMDAPIRNIGVEQQLQALFVLIDEERFDEARAAIARLGIKLGTDEPELTRASSLIHFLEGSDE